MDFKCDELILGKTDADSRALTSRFIDVEAGTEIKPVVVDEVTGAKLGTRAMRLVMPDES